MHFNVENECSRNRICFYEHDSAFIEFPITSRGDSAFIKFPITAQGASAFIKLPITARGDLAFTLFIIISK